MVQTSFSTGHQVTMSDMTSNSPVRVEPYDPSYRFNRIVYSKPNKPLYDIYSIDPLKILQAIDNDQLSSLAKITLLGRQIMREHLESGGTGIWDTLFNSAHQKALTACIFMAGNNYRPLPLSRVAISSQFLNYSMLVSRVQKNQVQPGDKIAVGIHDLKEQLYYVLLYRVDDLCQVTMERDRGNRAFLQPAANLTMEHACRIEYNGTMTYVDMVDGLEYDNDSATPFVGWVTRALADITQAYPFKPHFVPLDSTPGDILKLSKRLMDETEEATPTTYENFKKLCEEAYETARDNGDKELPVFEMTTTVGGDSVLVKLQNRYNLENKVYTFPVEEMEVDSLTETYLNNSDLKGLDLDDVVTATLLPATEDGAERIVRYFQIHY